MKLMKLQYVTLSFVIGLLAYPSLAQEKPNILIILCDDLGYGDLACFGHPEIKTPHIDQLAREGIRFTSFYSAAPVCSPSRVGLLTGRTPNRAGVYDWIPEYRQEHHARAIAHMRADEVTIPQLLKQAGYTTMMSGKWHCNSKFNPPDQPQPGDASFDHWFATQNNAAPSHENPYNFVRNGEEVGPLQGYSCGIVVDEVITWLRKHKEKSPSQPWFTYVTYHEPHEPVASPKNLVQQYLPKALNEDQAQYFANVTNLDVATGKLLDALDQLGYAQNTLVIFTSDNGPETLYRYPNANRSYGTTGPLRGMKLHIHEGGYRVPGIIRWPARIKAGQTLDIPVCSLDFLPTFCDLAGVERPKRLLDGANFLPALEGKPIQRERPLAWCYYNALNDSRVSLRDGSWKILGRLKGLLEVDSDKPVGEIERGIVVNKDNEALVKSTGFDRYEVYYVSKDISEKQELSSNSDAPVEALTSKLNDFYKQLVHEQIYWDVSP